MNRNYLFMSYLLFLWLELNFSFKERYKNENKSHLENTLLDEQTPPTQRVCARSYFEISQSSILHIYKLFSLNNVDLSKIIWTPAHRPSLEDFCEQLMDSSFCFLLMFSKFLATSSSITKLYLAQDEREEMSWLCSVSVAIQPRHQPGGLFCALLQPEAAPSRTGVLGVKAFQMVLMQSPLLLYIEGLHGGLQHVAISFRTATPSYSWF